VPHPHGVEDGHETDREEVGDRARRRAPNADLRVSLSEVL
jgi:hypothetical protein